MTSNAQDIRTLNSRIDAMREDMVSSMSKMVSIKAISPLSGGTGEAKRADFLEQKLNSFGVKVKRYDYKDESGAIRSNLIAILGSKDRTLWIVAHMDTVAEGDIALWVHDPFKAHVGGGKIFGRGTNDNGEALIGAMFAIKALADSGIDPKYNYGLVLVADEELGSKFGIQKLIKEGLFNKTDMFLVPDSNTKSGRDIEIAEKSILWLKITVNGKQVHASTPEKGVNAQRYSSLLMVDLDELLHKKYNARSDMFDPGASTFEMTKHEKNVDSINIVPGKDVFYMDSRILPMYKTKDIIKDIKKLVSSPKYKQVKVKLEPIQQEDAPPPTDKNAEVFVAISDSIRKQLNVEPKAVGIGGGTCAAYFRREGWPAVVWGIGEDVAHQPNEFAYINDIVKCAKVFAAMFIQE
jgi:succinyl-diaminopimelate desuccinylase